MIPRCYCGVSALVRGPAGEWEAVYGPSDTDRVTRPIVGWGTIECTCESDAGVSYLQPIVLDGDDIGEELIPAYRAVIYGHEYYGFRRAKATQ